MSWNTKWTVLRSRPSKPVPVKVDEIEASLLGHAVEEYKSLYIHDETPNTIITFIPNTGGSISTFRVEPGTYPARVSLDPLIAGHIEGLANGSNSRTSQRAVAKWLRENRSPKTLTVVSN